MNQEIPPLKRRCIVYIDGFNWYYSVLRHRPAWKWLNVESFFASLRLDEEVITIKYFTAWVEPNRKPSLKRDRQARYIKALESLPKVKIIFGKYQEREVTCRASCREKYRVPEEKKTDVNIAVNLMDDAIRQRAEALIIVSGDSDLEPAVEWVRKNHHEIKITVYIPSLPEEEKQRRNDFYGTIGVPCRFLPLSEIVRHQMPNRIVLAAGHTVEKPIEWI